MGECLAVVTVLTIVALHSHEVAVKVSGLTLALCCGSQAFLFGAAGIGGGLYYAKEKGYLDESIRSTPAATVSFLRAASCILETLRCELVLHIDGLLVT